MFARVFLRAVALCFLAQAARVSQIATSCEGWEGAKDYHNGAHWQALVPSAFLHLGSLSSSPFPAERSLDARLLQRAPLLLRERVAV